MTSENMHREEKIALIKEKIKDFRQREGLQINEWTALCGFSTPVLYRVFKGVDVKFSTIVSIVESSNRAVTYEELADLLIEKPRSNHSINELRKRALNILKKKKGLDEVDQEFGSDPMEANPL